MKTNRPKKTDIVKQVARLRSLPVGKEDSSDATDERIKSIQKLLGNRADSYEHLVAIVDRCILKCDWVPTPAVVDRIISDLASERMPFWEPPKREQRTRQDVLDDLAFQRKFAIDKPKLAGAAEERIAELELELTKFEGVLA